MLCGEKKMSIFIVSESGEHPTIFLESYIHSSEDSKQLIHNAKYIIKCVNNEPQMRSVLKRLIESTWEQQVRPSIDNAHEVDEALTEARDFLVTS